MLIGKVGLSGVVAFCALLGACSRDSALNEAKELQAAVAAVSQESGVCKLFTREEIEAAAGEPVSAGEGAGPLGSACRWGLRNSDERGVMIQIVPRDYWEDGTRQPGGEALSDIGEKAFVGPWLDDQRAGALTANGAVYVTSPRRDLSIALLKQAAPRVPSQE